MEIEGDNIARAVPESDNMNNQAEPIEGMIPRDKYQNLENQSNIIGDQELDRQNLNESLNLWRNQQFEMSNFFEIIEAMNSNDLFKQHYATIGLRKLLSDEHGPPIQPVIDANLVPLLVKFIQNNDQVELQFEAAWCLTNIASGTTQQAQTIVDHGGIPHFINLLKSSRIEIVEQAIWGIGNFAGDSPRFRDLILELGGLTPLLDLFNKNFENRDSIYRNGSWAITNLCQGKPAPNINLIIHAIPTLAKIIKGTKDSTILTDATQALARISKYEVAVDEIFNTGVLPSLVENLEYSFLALPSLEIIGSFLTGTEEQTNVVLETNDFVPKVFRYLQHPRTAIRREACWTISNITAGTSSQIGKIFSSPYYFDMLMKVAISDTSEVQSEAAWALANATKACSFEQIVQMIESGIIECFIYLLQAQNPKTVAIVIEAIMKILEWGSEAASQRKMEENEFLTLFEDKGGVEILEALQSHPDDLVYFKTQRILEKYFVVETFEDD